MNPAPTREHQEIEKQLLVWLETHWARPRGCRVHHQINVARPGSWPNDFRIPDLVLLLPERFDIDRDVFFEGPPNVVVEVRSPDDETYDKLAFYARLGVDEVWVVDRDTRRPELYLLHDASYLPAAAGADGWLHSPATGIELRYVEPARLEIQLAADPGSRASI